MKYKLNKSGILLLLATIASGTGAAYFAENYINSQLNAEKNKIREQYISSRVVVAKHNLKAGEILNAENLAIRDMPAGFLHKNVINESDSGSIIGKRITQPLNAGDPLLKTFIEHNSANNFSHLIESGHRALTFPVDINSSMAGLLRPGDRIDLMFTLNQGHGNVTTPLLRNILILATDSSVSNVTYAANSHFQTITLSVTPMDAAKITTAREAGSITVLLRSGKGKDRTVSELHKSVTINSLLGKQKKTYKRYKKIDIIIGN